MSRWLVVREEMPPGAVQSMVSGLCTITVLTLTQMRRRHGAARKFLKELWSCGQRLWRCSCCDDCSSEVIGLVQI